MKANDADGGSFGAITYSIGSGPSSFPPAVFSINKETGEICTSAVLDRDEGSESYEFTVTATDGVSEKLRKQIHTCVSVLSDYIHSPMLAIRFNTQYIPLLLPGTTAMCSSNASKMQLPLGAFIYNNTH